MYKWVCSFGEIGSWVQRVRRKFLSLLREDDAVAQKPLTGALEEVVK